MTTIAFDGGSSLCELGPREDVVSFFKCLNRFVAQDTSPSDYDLLTDRLYRRFLRQDELGPATELMAVVRAALDRVPTAQVDWIQIGVDPTKTELAIEKPTLAGVFGKYFDRFAHCVDSARLNHQAFCTYPGYRFEPVRVVVADQPWLLAERQRNLEEYESLQGAPFWLR